MGVALVFKGAPGYKNEFSGHRVGDTKEYHPDDAYILMRDMPGCFYEVGAVLNKEEKAKQEKPPANKMSKPVEDKSMSTTKKEKLKKPLKRRG